MPQHTPQFDTLAAIDLGSNSFHMIIARVVNEQLSVIDRIKDMVRLGGGLDEDGDLTPEASQRALETLARFGERVRHMPQGSVRVVGTNTLRKARNAKDFLREAREAIGHPIEIVSGREEGRLIYLGVAHGIHDDDPTQQRLVIDIGGGSTEVIIGKGFEVLACESLYMGCVSYSQRFFPDGDLTQERFQRAILAARQEARALEVTYPRLGWDAGFGASGTIKAIQDVIAAARSGTLGISLDALYKLRDRIVACGTVEQLQLDGLNKNRVEVFPGGVAILIGLFESLGIKQLRVSDEAMREGVLYDLLGRMHDEDVRDRTITAMASRYQVDLAHAARVERTALGLLEQVAQDWALDDPWFAKRLRWACQLHEIGLAIAHSRHHKHGSYLVENSDMPGFSRQDQQLLWAMVRTHRRSFKAHRFAGLPGNRPLQAQRLCVLLRLAILLNRNRSDEALPPSLRLQVRRYKLKLTFPPGWLDQAPLTRAELAQEASELSEGSFKLKIS